MHCFCCDMLLNNPSIDKPTGRYYCSECLEPTNQVILSRYEEELSQLDFFGTLGDSLEIEEVSIEEFYDEPAEDSNEY